LLQLLLTGIALIAAMRPRVIRVATPEPRGAAPGGITYGQLRHLIVGGILLVLGIWFALWLADRTQQVLTLLTVSILLAVALRPTVDRMSAWRLPVLHRTIPRALSIFLIYLLVAVVAAAIGFAVVPPLITEFQNLLANLPNYATAINDALQRLREIPFLSALGDIQNQIVTQIVTGITQAFNLVTFAVNLATGILSIGVVLVITFFLIYDAELIYNHFTSLLSPAGEERARAVTARMGRKIEGWLKGVLLLAIILGGVTTAVMYALSMPYPYLLGLAAGVFELVPIIGPYLGAAPAGAVALFTQPLWKFIVVVVYFFLIQQVENNILAPKIFGEQAELPPLLVILALLIGAAVYGVLGALVAVPLMAVVEVLWTDLIVPAIRRRTRGEQ
jgi:predicted PurR-regulated permease PerM